MVDEHDDLAAQFVALDGGQVAEGADQVVGQLRRNIRLFRLVMHSFSPLSFDLVKQMLLRCRKRHCHMPQYQSDPLRKTCTLLQSLTCRAVGRFGTRLHTESVGRFETMPIPKPSKRPALNTNFCGAVDSTVRR